jgi:hypothetical protein
MLAMAKCPHQAQPRGPANGYYGMAPGPQKAASARLWTALRAAGHAGEALRAAGHAGEALRAAGHAGEALRAAGHAGEAPGRARCAALACSLALALVIPAGSRPRPAPSAPARGGPAQVRPVAGCTSHTSLYGTLQACPASAPAGATVVVRALGCRGERLVFLGPLDYIGAGGGGQALPKPTGVTKMGWSEVKFTVPVTYRAGGNLDATVPVSSVPGFRLGSYPANHCSVPFQVTAPSGTRTEVYEPFAGTRLKSWVHIVARFTGTCLQGVAKAIELRNYYRCFTAPKRSRYSYVLDPCFTSPGTWRLPAHLVCPTNPLSGEAVSLTATTVALARATGPKDRAPRPARADLTPWALQLADGQLCYFASGAWVGLGPYSCHVTGPEAAPAATQQVTDCHVPSFTRPFWVAECQAKQSPVSPFRPIELVEVWF